MRSRNPAPHLLCTPAALQTSLPAPPLSPPNTQDPQPCSLPQPHSAPRNSAAVLHHGVLGAPPGALCGGWVRCTVHWLQ